MKLVYSILWYFLLLPLLMIFVIKMLLGKSGYTRARLSRFAVFKPTLKHSNILWHCVSVGEVVCVTPLIKRLQNEHPDLSITITTTTTTGADQVSKSFGNQVQHCYLPYDCGWLMRRLLNRIKPKVLLITEVELWPNLISTAKQRNINTAIINARMTNCSAASYAKLGRFFVGTAAKIDWISTQGNQDKQNYERLGVNPTKLVCNGNIKFELQDTTQRNQHLEHKAQQAHQHGRCIIVAASTHDPEEQMAIDAFRQLTDANVSVELWIVPRHPQRFKQVVDLLEQSKLNYTLYSEMLDSSQQSDDSSILLIDAMGVLNAAYTAGDIAFVGGSFAEKGGHNALEAALHKLPVVMGPSQFNNPAIYQQLHDAGNLITANNQVELERILLDWCNNKQHRVEAGQAGSSIIEKNRGALAANQALIETLL